jgi:hypothetical protein
MFGSRKVKGLESDIECLEEDKRKLKEELADLKLKKKMEEEDIKHMVKINNERKEIELEKEKVKLERKSAEEIAKVKDEYRDKTEQQLEKQLSNMKDMYGEILIRLPNYNVNHKISEGK